MANNAPEKSKAAWTYRKVQGRSHLPPLAIEAPDMLLSQARRSTGTALEAAPSCPARTRVFRGTHQDDVQVPCGNLRRLLESKPPIVLGLDQLHHIQVHVSRALVSLLALLGWAGSSWTIQAVQAIQTIPGHSGGPVRRPNDSGPRLGPGRAPSGPGRRGPSLIPAWPAHCKHWNFNFH
ncbi:hypothetical protein BGX38DRAFT_1263114 [Terfezia claveryi]|nr:hypothetical protein BGX38DRAFT_1263114 [Terfezia claveryi]